MQDLDAINEVINQVLPTLDVPLGAHVMDLNAKNKALYQKIDLFTIETVEKIRSRKDYINHSKQKFMCNNKKYIIILHVLIWHCCVI